MKILICDKISEKGVEKLKNAGFTVDVKTGMKPEELIGVISSYHAVVVRSATKITKDVIEAAKELKLIVRGGVGLDNVDAESAKKKNIKVCNTPGASTESVAELTVGLLLAICRKIPQADLSMKNGKWEKKIFEGIELYKKTLGLIGIGRIGKRVAEIAQKAFEMKILAYDPYVDSQQLEKENIKLVSLDELLSQSDFISLHLPKTQETKGLIGENAFSKMKKGVIIVNCARGGVVDEVSLLKAIENGTVAFAALDVFEKEPLPPDSPLLKCEKLILTPHLGASTVEGQARVSDEVADIIIKELK